MLKDMTTLNKRIRKKGRETLMYQWRKAKNLSLADIARQLNVTREAVRLWENGESRTTSDNIITISAILGVKPYDLERHFAIESMHRRGIDEKKKVTPPPDENELIVS